MTPRMKQTYDFIARYISKNGYSPSYREIQKALKIKSKTPVFRLCRQLEDMGYISTVKYKARSIKLMGYCKHCGRTDVNSKREPDQGQAASSMGGKLTMFGNGGR